MSEGTVQPGEGSHALNGQFVQPNGEKIRQLSRDKGWTQEVLARKVGCAKKTIENAEAGRRVRIGTLGEIAEALEVGDWRALAVPDPPPPIPENGGPDSGGNIKEQRRLFRIDATLQPSAEESKLLVEVGFFRIRLTGLGGPTEPVLCGCASARLLFKLGGGRSLRDPCFPTVPHNTKAMVEFGPGVKPSVRFEALEPPLLIDGRGVIDFAVSRPGEGRLRVAVTVDPEWFTAFCPTKELDSVTRIALDAFLSKLWQPLRFDF